MLQNESSMDRSNKKKLGNVCHQSFAVEDEEDGADDINYAMQQPSSNPPPLPNSGPPISDEDEEDRIQQRSNDRNSLGGSSYDKVGRFISFSNSYICILHSVRVINMLKSRFSKLRQR